MARYKLIAPYSEKSCLPCAISGVGVVDLTGKGYERVYPATIRGPEKRVKVPAATQGQLKALYEAGNRLIEKVEKPIKEEQNGE
jgi:hypothetical protein